MSEPGDRAAVFRALHDRDGAFVMPNPFDVGTARLLADIGFAAIATSSAALGFILGKVDAAAAMTREDGIAHLRTIVAATPLPATGFLRAMREVKEAGTFGFTQDSVRTAEIAPIVAGSPLIG